MDPLWGSEPQNALLCSPVYRYGTIDMYIHYMIVLDILIKNILLKFTVMLLERQEG